jgi:hypothetical protein
MLALSSQKRVDWMARSQTMQHLCHLEPQWQFTTSDSFDGNRAIYFRNIQSSACERVLVRWPEDSREWTSVESFPGENFDCERWSFIGSFLRLVWLKDMILQFLFGYRIAITWMAVLYDNFSLDFIAGLILGWRRMGSEAMWFVLPSPSSCASGRDRLALGYNESVPIWLCLDRFTERLCFASMDPCSPTAFDLTMTSSESVLESLFLTDWIFSNCYRYFVLYCLIVPGDNGVFQQCKIGTGVFRTAESCAKEWWHVVCRNNSVQ